VDSHRISFSDTSGANFPGLLERAGFHVRGRRADCRHCQSEGDRHGRSTVAFTAEVAFCHRCKWTANIRTLSRTLGVCIAPENREQRERRQQAARFSAWLNITITMLIGRLRELTRRADRARNILSVFPDCEPAWDALAEFYHRQSSLLAALDLLAFEKLSPWLEPPMTRELLATACNDAESRTQTGVAVGF
jgi:hypothetical protein